MNSRTISKSLSTIILGISRVKRIGNLRAKMARALSTKPSEGLCSSKASKKSAKKKWWSFSKKECAEPKQKKEETPSPELCRPPTEDPDLSAFGGTPYRTCGSAYIIQKERLPKEQKIEDGEKKLLDIMEKHPDIKNVEDPMPPFETVEKRMLDLDQRKLHPLYKKYIFLPKRTSNLAVPKFMYKSRSGPVSSEEIPAKLKCKEFLEKKNLFYDVKRVDPPRQLLARMLEMQLNEKPTMEKKSETNDSDDILKS